MSYIERRSAAKRDSGHQSSTNEFFTNGGRLASFALEDIFAYTRSSQEYDNYVNQFAEEEMVFNEVPIVCRVQRDVQYIEGDKSCVEEIGFSFELSYATQRESDRGSQMLRMDVTAYYTAGQPQGLIHTRINRIGGRDEDYEPLPEGIGRALYQKIIDSTLPHIAAQYPASMMHIVTRDTNMSNAHKKLTDQEWLQIFEPILASRGYTSTKEGGVQWKKAYEGKNTGVFGLPEADF